MNGERSSYLVGKAFRGFLLASVLTAAASQVGNLIDGLMLSHFINEQAMSAINITSPVSQILYSLCILMGVGGSMLAGMAIGNHDRKEASRLFSVVMCTTCLLGLAAALGGSLFIGNVVELLCPDVALQGYTRDYLEVILPASPVYMLMVVTQMFVTLDGEPRRVSAAVMVCALVNLSLDYIFIVGCGWAMRGAAIATVISYVSAIGVLLPHFRGKDALRFSPPRSFAAAAKIASMGMPFGVATVLIAVQMFGNNIVAMHFLGGSGIVTLSICMYLLMFSMIVLTGTLESFQPVAAILKGSGDNRGVSIVLRHAYTFMAVALGALAVILVFFPSLISSIFGIAVQATAMLQLALPAFAANIVLQCVVYLLIPVYQIYGHRRLALIISIGQPLLPMAFFGLLAYLSASGACLLNPWWGFAIGQICVVLLLLPFTLIKKGDHCPFILIPHDNPDKIYDVSVRPSFADMETHLIEAEKWLSDNGIGSMDSQRIIVACEECINNIISHALSNRKRSSIDLRITLDDRKAAAMIRDEGRPFNPVEQDPGTGIGLMIVKKMCDDMRYEYIFHQNVVSLFWTEVSKA